MGGLRSSTSAVVKGAHVSGEHEEFQRKLHNGAPALGGPVCRYAQSGEEVLWRPAAQKMAFGVACRAILGEKFTEEDMDYMFPRVLALSRGMLALVCFTCSLQRGVQWSNHPAGFVLHDIQDAGPKSFENV